MFGKDTWLGSRLENVQWSVKKNDLKIEMYIYIDMQHISLETIV